MELDVSENDTVRRAEPTGLRRCPSTPWRLRESRFQVRLALAAAAAINRSLEAAERHHRRGGEAAPFDVLHGEIFRALHSLLLHAACASRALVPRLDAGDALQALLPAALSSSALRGCANDGHAAFEHWLAEQPGEHVIADVVAPRGAFLELDESQALRWYDPQARRLVLHGQAFEIQPLVSAIETLSHRLDARLQTAVP